MIAGDYFITPHAVRQFQARIPGQWRLNYEQALALIVRALNADARPAKPLPNGKGVYVRVRGALNFRAVVIEGDGKPSVVTILRSGK